MSALRKKSPTKIGKDCSISFTPQESCLRYFLQSKYLKPSKKGIPTALMLNLPDLDLVDSCFAERTGPGREG